MNSIPLNASHSIIDRLDLRSLGHLRCALGSNARKDGDIELILKSVVMVKINSTIDQVLHQAATSIVTFFETWKNTYHRTCTHVTMHIGEYMIYNFRWSFFDQGYLLFIRKGNESIMNIATDNTGASPPLLYHAILHILRDELSPDTLPVDHGFIKEFQLRWKRMFDDPVNSFIEYRYSRLYNWDAKPFLLRAMIQDPIWIKLTSFEEVYASLEMMEDKINCVKEQLRAAEELTASITSLYYVI